MGYKQYCKDYENIENYDKAKADNFLGWEVHHRLETHNSDGERRSVDITQKELKALGMYYNRPASELIFLRKSEHSSFNKGKKRSEETKKKIAEAHKGEKNPFYGKHLSDEHKNKLREARKGKPKSEETKNKIAEAHKGKKHSDETIRKMREAKKGKNIWSKGRHWYNNGKINIMSKECPEGFVPGILR